MADVLTDRFQHVTRWTVELRLNGREVLTSYVGTYAEAKFWANSCGAVEVLAIRED